MPLALACALLACTKLDRVFEGPPTTDARLSVGFETNVISVPQGGTTSLLVTVTRIGDYAGPVTLTVEQAPGGFSASLANETTSGQITTAMLSLRVDAGVALGTFNLIVRGHADRLNDATSSLSVNITAPLAYSLALSLPSVTIARGGIARVAARLDRTNYSPPVTLSLDGAPGITAAFDVNPVTSSGTDVTLSVAQDVPTGAYTMSMRATAPGISERSAPITVIVTADPLQLIVRSPVSAAQASVGSTDIIVNRSGYAGPVTLSVERLPPGVSATLLPDMPAGNASILRLAIGPDAVPGTSLVTIRGRGAGVPDATADLLLTVTVAKIALSLSAQSVDVFQGSSVKSALTIARTSFTGAVAIDVDGVPPGLTVAANPTRATGDTVSLTFAASPVIEPGTYQLTLRATPEGLSSDARQSATIAVTVRAASAGGGNVLLDWSACAAPQWVAGQDGSGPWQRLLPVAGTFRFAVTSGKGGFAFVEGGNTVAVRYMTQAELTGRPVDMCPPRATTKTVRGTANYDGFGGQWFFQLGGGIASSTPAIPDFTIAGVREGVHDLVGWTVFGTGFRALIRRDLDVPDGEPLGSPVSLLGPESFSTARQTFTVGGFVVAGEQLRHTMSYLTRADCTVNALYASAAHGLAPVVQGIPEPVQRPNDFHLLTMTSSGATGVRTVSTAFHGLTSRFIALPPSLTAPSLQGLPGPYKRLQATIGVVPSAYNGAMEFRYNDGAWSMSTWATAGYSGSEFVIMTMPDLSTVPDWPNASAIASGATVAWSITLNGASSPQSTCTEARTTVQLTKTGIL